MVLLLGVVAACSSGGVAPVSDPTTLRLAVSKISAGLDPAESLVTSYLRSFGAGESLAKIAPDGHAVPELAASLRRSAPNTWTVTLRDGATFQSGAPVDATAVRASLERSRERNPLAANLLQGVRIAATGPGALEFTTDEPQPFLDLTLAHYELQIHNAAAYAGLAGSATPQQADLTGPFRVTAFTAGQELTLQRNPRWWGVAPSVQQVVIRQVADPQARAQVAIAGQADIVDQLPSSAVAELRATPGLKLVGAPAANTVAVYLNPTSPAAPALADKGVRQALSWAVDRAAVAEVAGEGLVQAAPSWLASNPAYPQAAQQGYARQDVALAERLLDEAGWVRGTDGRRAKDGRPLTFRLQTWGTEQPTGEVLQAQWAAIGVAVDLSHVDNALVTQSRERGDWDAQTAAFTTLGDVPSLFAVQIGPGGSGNYGRYVVPEVGILVREAAAAATEPARTAAILQLNAVMVDLVPSIPVHPRPQGTALSDRLTGFVPHPLQYENLVQPGYALGG